MKYARYYLTIIKNIDCPYCNEQIRDEEREDINIGNIIKCPKCEGEIKINDGETIDM